MTPKFFEGFSAIFDGIDPIKYPAFFNGYDDASPLSSLSSLDSQNAKTFPGTRRNTLFLTHTNTHKHTSNTPQTPHGSL